MLILNNMDIRTIEDDLLWQAVCEAFQYGHFAVDKQYYGTGLADRPIQIGMIDRWQHEVRLFADVPWIPYTNIRVFLRPMTSMTEKEKEQFFQLMLCGNAVQIVEFYKSGHFDYMLLIDKGLALEAPKEMYMHFGDMDVTVVNVEHKDKL